MSELLNKKIRELEVAHAMLNAKRYQDLQDFQREVAKLQKQFDWLKARKPESRIYVGNSSGGGGGTPGGEDTQLQFNNAGEFGASEDLTWTAAGNTLTIGSPGNPLGFLVLGEAGGVGAISSAGDLLVNGATFDFVTGGISRLTIDEVGEWTVNGSAGDIGDVLTSQGPGESPAWVTPTGGGSWRGARAHRTSTQSPVASGATVSWEATGIDTDGFWDVGAPTRLTIPSGVSLVRMFWSVLFENGSVAGSVSILPRKNGGSFALPDTFGNTSTRQGTTGFTTNIATGSTGVLAVSATDYFELETSMSSTITSGGIDSIQSGTRTWFEIEVLQ